MSKNQQFQIVIVGGGSGGITVAAQLKRADSNLSIAIIEPSDKHYYQPLWTLVGAGVFPKERSERPEKEYIPAGTTWIRDAVTSFHPDENAVTTQGGLRIGYEQLVVAPGIQINWDGIKGLKEALGRGGVCSNYSYGHVQYTWECIHNFQGGTAIFTMPATPVKCGGAPQKIMYLADDAMRRNGVRERSRLIFASASPKIFTVPKYAEALEKVLARKSLETRFRHNLIELRPESREAVFEQLDTKETVVLNYDMIHVTPPQGPPDFIRNSPLADKAGWVDVHKHTLQHTRYPNIFSLGDASSLPTSKTGAAIRKEAPVLVANLLAHRRGLPLTSQYDGYTSCPLTTGYGKLILAEFDYDLNPKESFPFNQAKERWSMWILKKFLLPWMYWTQMLRGRM